MSDQTLADKVQAGFPEGIPLPEEIRRLCEFAEDHSGEISGNFELETEGWESALAWFNDDEAAASRFAVFGRGPDGSLYALWLHADGDSSKAPVVLLDSEATENQVIAADARDFLRLLAMGYEEPGRYPTLEPEDPDSAENLRDWLSETYGIAPPQSAEELVNAAQSRHPNLDAWIQNWQEG